MTMMQRSLFLFCGYVLATGFQGLAQRTYSPNSVLSTGNWYKLGVSAPGIYRIDVPLLNNLGVNTTNLSSASIKLYGNGGQMPGEANNSPRTDDLVENSILIVDGGDGVINGADYILFYAGGPDEWIKD